MSWSREQVEILLEEYEKYPSLYAIQNPLYKNKHARLEALQKIQGVLCIVKPNVTIADIKAKLTGLRNTFFAEKKKKEASLRSGSGTDDVSLNVN